MAKKVTEKIKLTINEWLENLPSKEKARKIYELMAKCKVALSTVYNWRAGKTPRRKHWELIQKVAGDDIKIIFN